MTAAALLARVNATELAPAWRPVPYVVDWGQPRARARRHSLRRSGMHDGPRGAVTYHRLPDALSEDERTEVNSFDRAAQHRYLRGRSAGLGHDAAMVLVAFSRGEADGEDAARMAALY